VEKAKRVKGREKGEKREVCDPREAIAPIKKITKSLLGFFKKR
jgi:hypothetical protein